MVGPRRTNPWPWVVLLVLPACGEFLGLERPRDRAPSSPGVVDAGGGEAITPPCEAPTVRCGPVCADLSSSDLHCGRCDHSCLGQGCEGGRCRPVARVTELGVASNLTVGGGGVYWLGSDAMAGTFTVGRVGRDGPPCRGTGCSVDLGAWNVRFCLALLGSSVYVGHAGGFVRLGTDLRGATAVLPGASPRFGCMSDGGALVWGETGPSRVGLSYDGERETTLVDGTGADVGQLTAQGGRVFFTLSSPTQPSGVFTVSTAGSCTAFECEARVPDVGIAALAPAPAQGAVAAILLTARGSSPVVRLPVDHFCNGGDACAAPLGAVASGTTALRLVTDDRYVYWISQRAILRAPLDGSPCEGACEPLLEADSVPRDLAVDEAYVYALVDAPDADLLRRGSLLRIPK